MKKAKISEIFLSIQGEGLYFGIPQLFIRFYDCNLSCAFCDTRPDSYKTYTVKGLMQEIAKHKKPYHSLSLTGGEPLLEADFIEGFLPEYKRAYRRPVYLETNGTLSEALFRIIEYIDIIAMDFKLSSSTKEKSFWEEHEKSLRIARNKSVFIKTVITPNTSPAEIVALSNIVGKINKNIPVILQPVTSTEENCRVGRKELEYYRYLLTDSLTRVEIIPQLHKLLGIR